MSTRKLILAALACGLAILVAGGVFLLNVARNRDELTVPDARPIGEVVQVGPYRAGVLAQERRDDAVVLTVRVTAVDATLSDAAAPWSLSIGGLRDPVDVGGLPAPPCSGAGVAVGSALECALAFAPKEGTGFAEFATTSEGAQAKERWFLPG